MIFAQKASIVSARRRAFTTVEIIVVLLILTLLSSLLFTGFARIKSRARQASCASNLRQIELSFQMYLQDARGYFPQFRVSSNENCAWADQIYPYIRSSEVFKCPSFKYGDFKVGCPPSEKTNDDTFPFATWDGSYDLNHFPRPARFNKSFIRNPHKTILFCDGTGGGAFFGEDEGGSSDGSSINPRDFSGLGNRHNHGSNICFADGHVKWMRHEELLDMQLWKAW